MSKFNKGNSQLDFSERVAGAHLARALCERVAAEERISEQAKLASALEDELTALRLFLKYLKNRVLFEWGEHFVRRRIRKRGCLKGYLSRLEQSPESRKGITRIHEKPQRLSKSHKEQQQQRAYSRVRTVRDLCAMTTKGRSLCVCGDTHMDDTNHCMKKRVSAARRVWLGRALARERRTSANGARR